MARLRSRAANRARHPTIPQLTWTLDELCAAANCSRSYLEKEKRAGRGPREIEYGRVRRVTPEDGRQWIADRRAEGE
jgi:AraC-like DNA-binding protein